MALGLSEKEMVSKYAYGGVKEWLFAIAAAIYVGGMFLLLYVYQSNPSSVYVNYTLIPDASYLSIFGAILLFGQLFVAAWKTPNEPQES